NHNDVALTAPTVATPTTVYVDDSWAGTPAGTDPADDPVGGLVFGSSAFAAIQDAIDHVAAGGTVIVFGGTYAGAVNVNKTLAPVQAAVNSLLPAETVVNVNGAVTLGATAAFTLAGADLAFGSSVNGTTGTESLTVTGGAHDVSFQGAVGATTPLASLTLTGRDVTVATVGGAGAGVTGGLEVTADGTATL